MKNITRSALVNFSDQQMYKLINDIEAYPEFMVGCEGAEVLASGEGWLQARLDLNQMGLKQSFVTKNTLTPPFSMKMELVSGPFKKFVGEWKFEALSENACKVIFSLSYEFSNMLVGMMVGSKFEQK